MGDVSWFIACCLVLVLVSGCGGDDEGNGDDRELPPDPAGREVVGNWSWVSGTAEGEPVTQIRSGWLAFHDDGTWSFSFDYGYTVNAQAGTYQAGDGRLVMSTFHDDRPSSWTSSSTYAFTDDG
ncbi:hypothetical protein JXA12_05925, partial [Candidatus Woesearchaeota archaeon]|nr:hypothetical protein [Candidatus Woesearchaeota archaeon]